MTDPTDYEKLFCKRRVRDVYATGSLIPKKLTASETMASLFPFEDSMPSPAEFQAILDRTTPAVADTSVPMEIEACARDNEENLAAE